MQKCERSEAEVSSSSMVELKAELFRKQEEYRQQKLTSIGAASTGLGFIKGKHTAPIKKPGLFSKRNAGVSERAARDVEERQEEEDVFDKARKSLEAKALLYEQMSHGSDIPEEDGSGVFLVDFQKKAIDRVVSRRDEAARQEEYAGNQKGQGASDELAGMEDEMERQLLEQPVPEPQTPDDEWVDYVDAYGRTRSCLRRDLPALQKQDLQLRDRKRVKEELETTRRKDFEELRDHRGEGLSLMSDDMRRELERQAWERQETETMEQEKQGPIHYADVQHKEVRTHGVGFYKFDREEESRQEQMDQLHKLRDQTKSERSRSERVKEKRKAALAVRLAKVKQRKREKLGLPQEEEEEKVISDEDENIGPKLSEQVEPKPLTRDDSWRAHAPLTRDWDKGKHVTPEQSEQAWLEKQRTEREDEFAPPTFYYKTPGNRGNKAGGRSLADMEAGWSTGRESKPGSDGSSDNVCKVEEIVGEKLSELRGVSQAKSAGQAVADVSNADKISNKAAHSNNSFVSQIPMPAASIPVDVSMPPPGFNMFTPPPEVIPANTPAPPSGPHMATATYGWSVLPPPPPTCPAPMSCYNAPTPEVHHYPAPSTGFNAPPPDIRVPPPGYSSPVEPIATSNTQAPCPNVSSACNPIPGHGYSVQNYGQQGSEVTVKKVVPKLSIVDTRLMDGD
ncbi:coiled-coil domain-containing protein 174-like [Mya arenaria]|uniref:coiled-coil domain-containing protein 174-like n=1 Tax=Mya arenaria TaxID=6604 RepID=UPI0022E0E716|nr:coiled-coil domain-containing protein 174-like [Mya arenaria]